MVNEAGSTIASVANKAAALCLMLSDVVIALAFKFSWAESSCCEKVCAASSGCRCCRCLLLSLFLLHVARWIQ